MHTHAMFRRAGLLRRAIHDGRAAAFALGIAMSLLLLGGGASDSIAKASWSKVQVVGPGDKNADFLVGLAADGSSYVTRSRGGGRIVGRWRSAAGRLGRNEVIS